MQPLIRAGLVCRCLQQSPAVTDSADGRFDPQFQQLCNPVAGRSRCPDGVPKRASAVPHVNRLREKMRVDSRRHGRVAVKLNHAVVLAELIAISYCVKPCLAELDPAPQQQRRYCDWCEVGVVGYRLLNCLGRSINRPHRLMLDRIEP